ncbi:hypothetical protein U9M48_029406 [Paspalum notatum var. saurae]|uniref:Uncharacterized protein n=1 Tax=Paspalum notatum var. saurae TaxID=547442 RepID=A0AAQ3U0W7_PASNO
MAGLVPESIVLALGAAALGAPDALRLLLGRGPAADLTFCVVLISAFTAHVLGTLLLSLFVRKAPRAGGGAAMDLFAQVARVVSVGAALLVTACHLLASGAGGGWVRAVGELGAKNPVVAAIVVIGAACSLPFAMALLRFVRRGARSATGGATARRVGKMTSLGFSLACLVLLATIISYYAPPSWREPDIGEL